MLDIRKQAALSDTVAPQLVSHDHPRHVLQACKQPSEEALGGIGVSPFLNKDIEHNAVLIDGTFEDSGCRLADRVLLSHSRGKPGQRLQGGNTNDRYH